MPDATKELNAENAENAEKKLKLKKLSGLCELGGKKMRESRIDIYAGSKLSPASSCLRKQVHHCGQKQPGPIPNQSV